MAALSGEMITRVKREVKHAGSSLGDHFKNGATNRKKKQNEKPGSPLNEYYRPWWIELINENLRINWFEFEKESFGTRRAPIEDSKLKMSPVIFFHERIPPPLQKMAINSFSRYSRLFNCNLNCLVRDPRLENGFRFNVC